MLHPATDTEATGPIKENIPGEATPQAWLRTTASTVAGLEHSNEESSTFLD